MALAIIIVYLLALFFTSWYSTRLQKQGSSKEFLFADQKLGTLLVGVTIAGLAIGGTSTTGVAQNAFTAGISAAWYDVAWAMGALLMAFCFAGKLRNAGFRTINGMWNQLFGKGFQTLGLVIQLVTQITIVALQVIAGGTIIHAIIPSISFGLGLIVSVVVLCLIAVVGGMWSTALTNIINVVLIYVGLVVGCIAAVKQYGGFDVITAALPVGKSGDGSHWWNLVSGMGTAAVVAWCLTMLLQASPAAGTIQVAISAKSDQTARRGFVLGAILMIPAGFISAIFGIIAAGFFPGLEKSSMAMATVTATLNPVVCGLLLAGVMAACISTASGLLVSLSTMTTNDLIIRFFKPDLSDKMQVVCSRVIIVVFSIVAYIIATQVSGILGTIMSVLALWAPYTILMFGVFFFPKTLKKSSGWLVFGVGIVAFVLSKFIVPSLAIAGQPIYTTFIVSLVMYFVAALADKRVCFEGQYVYKEG
jgi:solute:Na+ symporter, SSS family